MPPRRKPVQKRVAQKADDKQSQAQQQNVVVNIGHRATTARRRVVAKRKAAPKKRAPAKRPAAQQQAGGLAPVIVPFTRVPPIWIQQPEPVRPFASNEPAVPVSLARQIAADKAEERMKMNPSVAEMAIQTEPPRPALVEEISSQPSVMTAISSRKKAAPAKISEVYPEEKVVQEVNPMESLGGGFAKAAPSVQVPPTMAAIAKSAETAAQPFASPPRGVSQLRKRNRKTGEIEYLVDPSEWTDAERASVEQADQKNQNERLQRELSPIGRSASGGGGRRRVRQIETGELMRSKSTEY